MENNNINIERAVLSSFLSAPAMFELSLGKLDPSDFYLPAHRYMYEAMLELDAKDSPLDDELLRVELLKQNRWDESAMLEVLATNPLPSCDSYIEQLREYRQTRELQDLSNEIRKMNSQGDEIHDIVGYVSQTIDNITDQSSTAKNKDISKIVDDFEEDFKSAQKLGDFVGIKSGIKNLDSIIGAFTPGTLVVVAARPSMGKTSFATTLTNYADSQSVGVLFDSMEMEAKDILRRLHAHKSNESLSDIKRGLIKDPQRAKDSLQKLRSSKNIIIHDQTYLNIHQLIAKASAVFRKNKHVKYWFVDHLRFIKKEGKNIPQEMSEITKLIKKTAKEHGVTAFVLSQLNRENEKNATNKRPMLSHLRESGVVEEDADIVLALHRPSYYDRSDPSIPEEPINEAEILILKNRDGASGCAKCHFDGPHASFINETLPSVVYYDEKPVHMGLVL